jgi:hypothetical protein
MLLRGVEEMGYRGPNERLGMTCNVEHKKVNDSVTDPDQEIWAAIRYLDPDTELPFKNSDVAFGVTSIVLFLLAHLRVSPLRIYGHWKWRRDWGAELGRAGNALVSANNASFWMVGNPSLTGLWKGCPSSARNLQPPADSLTCRNRSSGKSRIPVPPRRAS